ncbi:hypothetical protein ABIA38_006328 [Embleya sp. AB8]
MAARSPGAQSRCSGRRSPWRTPARWRSARVRAQAAASASTARVVAGEQSPELGNEAQAARRCGARCHQVATHTTSSPLPRAARRGRGSSSAASSAAMTSPSRGTPRSALVGDTLRATVPRAPSSRHTLDPGRSCTSTGRWTGPIRTASVSTTHGGGRVASRCGPRAAVAQDDMRTPLLAQGQRKEEEGRRKKEKKERTRPAIRPTGPARPPMPSGGGGGGQVRARNSRLGTTAPRARGLTRASRWPLPVR